MTRRSTATTQHLTHGNHTAAEAAIDCAQRLDGWLRAFLSLRPGGDARTAASNAAQSPLAGLPITVKGPRGYRHPATQRLLQGGAVPIGTTSIPRGSSGHQTWGHTDRGPTRNPWRADRSPGGSSAGAAATVAAGIVALSCGSDGAGSIRIPAAWCGVIGFKPTAGRTPTPDPSGLAVPGALVRDPRMLRTWAGTVFDDGLRPARELPTTAAWSATLGYAGPHLDPEVADIAEHAARSLSARAGLHLTHPALDLADPQRAWMTLRTPTSTGTEQEAAQRVRQGNNRQLAEFFQSTDLLMTPTTPGRAHGHGGPGDHLSVALTWGINLSGHPAVSIPAGFTADGCPVGLQLIAARGADEYLLQLLEDHVPQAAVAPDARRTMTNPET